MPAVENWLLGWLIAGAVVILAAALLVWILAVAWSLERQTRRALEALRRIDANTKPVWALHSTAERFEQVREEIEAVEDALAQLASHSGARPKEGAES